MSTPVRIRASVPRGKFNGLDVPGLAAHLERDPGTRILIALVAPVTVVDDLEHGARTVTLGIEAVELVDTEEARTLLRRTYEERTGELTLDLDTPDPAASVFATIRAGLADAAEAAGIDLTTGEIRRPKATKAPAKKAPAKKAAPTRKAPR